MSAQAAQGWQRLLEAAQREATARREERQLQMSMVLDEGAASGVQGGAQAADGGSLSVAGSAVPAALADSSNIPDYLATAQELEARDPAVADLGTLCSIPLPTGAPEDSAQACERGRGPRPAKGRMLKYHFADLRSRARTHGSRT